MRYLITALLSILLFPYSAFSQRYERDEVVYVTDSLLRNQIKPSFFPFCTIDSSSFYKYRKGKRYGYSMLLNKKRTHKHFDGATVTYLFRMPYPNCVWLDTIKGKIIITVDSALALTTVPDVSFIPDINEAGGKCNFISIDTAISIAKKDSLKIGVTPPYAYIHYHGEPRHFVWIVMQTIWNDEDFENDKPTKNDMVVIDATTGAIEEHKVIPYAPRVY